MLSSLVCDNVTALCTFTRVDTDGYALVSDPYYNPDYPTYSMRPSSYGRNWPNQYPHQQYPDQYPTQWPVQYPNQFPSEWPEENPSQWSGEQEEGRPVPAPRSSPRPSFINNPPYPEEEKGQESDDMSNDDDDTRRLEEDENYPPKRELFRNPLKKKRTPLHNIQKYFGSTVENEEAEEEEEKTEENDEEYQDGSDTRTENIEAANPPDETQGSSESSTSSPWDARQAADTTNAPWTDPVNQDHLSDKVSITRDFRGGLFNAKVFGDQHNSWIAPSGTQWAYLPENTTYEESRCSMYFCSWKDCCAQGNARSLPGKTCIVHLLEEDVYYTIKFLSWTSGRYSNRRRRTRTQGQQELGKNNNNGKQDRSRRLTHHVSDRRSQNIKVEGHGGSQNQAPNERKKHFDPEEGHRRLEDVEYYEEEEEQDHYGDPGKMEDCYYYASNQYVCCIHDIYGNQNCRIAPSPTPPDNCYYDPREGMICDDSCYTDYSGNLTCNDPVDKIGGGFAYVREETPWVDDYPECPVCYNARGTPDVIQGPADGQFTVVGIAGVTPADANITILGVGQDEDPKCNLPLGSSGDVLPNAEIQGNTVLLRRLRPAGRLDAFRYTLHFKAESGGGSCTGEVQVCFPVEGFGCWDWLGGYDATSTRVCPNNP